MQYMLLIYENDEERVGKMDERMRSATSTTSVRVVDGKTHVVDGPYAEAKEQLGGFHIIDVPDLDTALVWAARCPTAQRGTVEIRPVWPYPG